MLAELGSIKIGKETSFALSRNDWINQQADQVIADIRSMLTNRTLQWHDNIKTADGPISGFKTKSG